MLLTITGGVFLDKSINELLMTRWDFLSDYELKLYSIICYILILILGIFFSILCYFLMNLNFIWSLIGFVLFDFMVCIIIYKRDYLDNKYGLFTDEFIGLSYQGTIIFFSLISFLVSWFIIPLAFHQGGIYSAIAFGLTVYFPFIFMFLRLNVYKNENCCYLLIDDEFGNQYCSKVMGYHPLFYFMLGFIFSIGPLGISIHNLLNSIFLKNTSFDSAVIYFVIVLIGGCLILSPDIMNKILPFELKTGGGMVKFIVLSFILIIVLLSLFLRGI